MKTPSRVSSTKVGSAGRMPAPHWTVLLILLGILLPVLTQASQPRITSIRPEGTNLLVVADVPEGFVRITLESRSRFGTGNWAPAAVAQLDGKPAEVTFKVASSQSVELLRVRADSSQALPARFYQGTNSFVTVSSGSDAPGRENPGGITSSPNANGPQDATRAVVESDIWKLDGDTLYFFNQYRGLQVIDIKNPDAATVRGTLEMPAAGEQMYLLNSEHVVLLARNGCSSYTDQSQVVVVDVSDVVPQVAAELSVPGYIQESRMVGTALYVASQTYRTTSTPTNTVWEWGTMVSSFDLSNPVSPVARGTLWYSGYGNVVSATDTYLFVVTQDPSSWWQSVVRVIDITSPDGTMASFGSVRTTGRIDNKFKLNYSGEIFTTVSEDWHWNNGTTLVTKLETFRLPDPRSAGPLGIVKLGELELGKGERLQGTRFDGNLAYVVTFFRIDPLWVVDLSDPLKPHIAGELEVPGWSTYIEPLGDRLVAVGVETNRVAVSLFDVHDPTKPALLSRVALGTSYSWSEANYDEKAFKVLPEIGLILVPYSGDATNGWTSQVQLIDLTSSNLVARDIIEHEFQPRRATYSHNRVLSISGWELLSVDATDRDKPRVSGDVDLAWSVDRAILVGDYILEIANGSDWYWYGPQGRPTIKVARADRPGEVLSEFRLEGAPVVGAEASDGKLYLARAQWYGAGDTNEPNFFVTVLDLSNLPSLSRIGEAGAKVASYWASKWEPFWVGPGELVWAGSGGGWWGWFVNMDGPASRFGPWWGGYGAGQLVAFDVSKPSEPRLDSVTDLTTNGWWQFSKPYGVSNLVYLSHTASERLTEDTNSLWVQRCYLDVVDFTDPVSPTLRKPVNIPGTLQGIARAGELLFTSGIHWTTNQSDWTEWLDALGYDGVQAHLIATMAIPNVWPRPLLVLGESVLLGRPGYDYTTTNVVPHELQTWRLTEEGKWSLAGSLKTDEPVSFLVERSGLLAAQDNYSSLLLLDASDPAALRPIGKASRAGCLWYDLDMSDGSLTRGLWVPLGAYGIQYKGLQGK